MLQATTNNRAGRRWISLTISLLLASPTPTLQAVRGSKTSFSIDQVDAAVLDTNVVDYWDDPKCFETSEELKAAVNRYQTAQVYDDELAKRYGWPIGRWCVDKVEDFSNLFSAKHHRYFNEPLNDWDMSLARDLSGMFQNCHWFNQPLDQWDVSGVTSTQRMFAAARNFNQPLSRWDTSRVVDMSYMFLHAFAFDQMDSLKAWNIGRVNNMEGMFRDARALDASKLNWDVSHVTNTKMMVSQIPGVSINLRGAGSDEQKEEPPQVQVITASAY